MARHPGQHNPGNAPEPTVPAGIAGAPGEHVSMPPSNEKKPLGGVEGFRFNAVAEEPTREVLTPRVDPAARRRALIIVVFAVIAVALLAFLTLNPLGTQTRDGSGGKSREFRPSYGEPGG